MTGPPGGARGSSVGHNGSGGVAERVSPATKAARHAKIAGILGQPGEPVRSQEELADRLTAVGIRVTQATLSRDLDELGAVRLRGPGGALVYALPPDPAEVPVNEGDDAIFRQAAAAIAGLAGFAAGTPTAAAAGLAKVASDLLVSAEASGIGSTRRVMSVRDSGFGARPKASHWAYGCRAVVRRYSVRHGATGIKRLVGCRPHRMANL